MKSTKASVKAAEKERIKRKKEIERQKKQEEKEKKLLDKKRDQAMKEAEREARRAAQPGECHRVSSWLELKYLVCIKENDWSNRMSKFSLYKIKLSFII